MVSWVFLVLVLQDPAVEPLPPGTIARIQAPTGAKITCLAFSPDGKTLATGCDDKAVRLWEARSGKLTSTLEGHEAEVRATVFLLDETLASGSADKTVRIWDVVLGKCIRTLAVTGEVQSISAASKGRTLAAGCKDRSLTAWTMPTGKVLFSHRKVDGEPFSLATSPDGKAVLAAVADRFELYLWDATTGKQMRTFDWGNAAAMVLSVAWSPDGKRIAAGVYGSLRVWEVETGKQVIECFADPKSDSAWFNEGIVFSPDSKLLAIPGPKGPRLWDATTGKELVVKGLSRPEIAVSFSPDAKLLASADGQTVLVWDLSVVLKK